MKGTTASGTAWGGGNVVNNQVVIIASMFGMITFALLLQGAGNWGELYLQDYFLYFFQELRSTLKYERRGSQWTSVLMNVTLPPLC